MQPKIPKENYFLLLYHNYTSVHQNIRMTRNFNWNIIVDTADNRLIIWPICSNNFITSIKYSCSNIYFVKVKGKFAIFFNDIWTQIKVYHTLATVFRLVFYNKKFFTVKYVTNLFAHSEFLSSN